MVLVQNLTSGNVDAAGSPRLKGAGCYRSGPGSPSGAHIAASETSGCHVRVSAAPVGQRWGTTAYVLSAAELPERGLGSPWRDVVCSVAQHSHGTFRATLFSLVGWLPCRQNVAQGGRPTKASRREFCRRNGAEDGGVLWGTGETAAVIELSGHWQSAQLDERMDWRRV